MSMTVLVVLTALASASPRAGGAVKQRADKDAPIGLAADLTLSLTARPEHSKGGSDMLSQLGLRGAYMWTSGGKRGLTLGGELALRSLNPGGLLTLSSPLAESDGSDTVSAEVYSLMSQVGGVAGWRFATNSLSLTPHVSAGLYNGLALVRMISPGTQYLRPRYLAGIYAGGGVIGTFHFAMLRLDGAVGYTDGRPEYRFDTGLGVMF